MRKEISPQEIEQKRNRVNQVLGQRENLIERVGSGEIKIRSSWENTLRVGRVREKVRSSVERLRAKQDLLDQVKLRQTQLIEMEDLVSRGSLPQDVLEMYQHEFAELVTSLERKPISVAEKEQNESKVAEAVVFEEASKDSSSKSPKFRLPTGEEIGGKNAELLNLLSQTSAEDNMTFKRIAAVLYSDLPYKIVRKKLSSVIAKTRRSIEKHGMGIMHNTPDPKTPREQQGYYLSYQEQVEKPQEPLSSLQPTDTEPERKPVQKEELRLPASKKYGGRINQLLELVAQGSPDALIKTDYLIEALYPGVDPRVSSGRFRNVVADARRILAGTEYELVCVSTMQERGKGEKGGYYLRRITNSEERIVASEQKQEEVSRKEQEAVKPLAEYGPLSRTDVAMLAAAMRVHKQALSSLVEKKGVKLIDDSSLVSLLALQGAEVAKDLGLMSQEEKDKFICESRISALDKARALIESHDFEQTMERIYEQNPDVWCLILNLYEMYIIKVQFSTKSSTKQKEGIAFLQELLANPEAGKQRLTLVDEPRTTPVPERPKKAPVKNQPVTVFAKTSSKTDKIKPQVESPAQENKTEQQETHPIIEGARPVTLAEVKPKLKAIEARDSEVRTRLNEFLDDILQRPEFNAPVTGATMNRVYQKLKQTTVDKALEDKLVKVLIDKDGHPRFDVSAIAALLYVYNYGQNLPAKLKRQAQEIAAEELKKRENS